MEPIYRIVPLHEWPRIEASGEMLPGPVDVKDGFIHLSDADTVLRTADLYFPPATNPLVLEIDPVTLGTDLKREYVEEREAVFPHLYAPSLPLSSVTALHQLLHEGGRYRFGRRAPR